MRVVIQRVTHASVTIDGICKSAIKEGFMILLGIEAADSQEDADWLCKKIVNLRVFDDENGVMNKVHSGCAGRNLGGEPVHTDGFDQEGNRPLTSGLPDMKLPFLCTNTSAMN